MKNKVLALSAAVLLSAGIAFSFVKPAGAACKQPAACTSSASAASCGDTACPIGNCPLGCGGGSCCGK